MRWSTRVLLSLLAAILVPLIVLTLVGLPSVSFRFTQSAETDLRRWAHAVDALVATALGDLEREARLLARDPAVVQGLVKGDWSTLARGASPRMLALTLEKVADLVLIVDERGMPLVQVPVGPAPAGTDLPLGSSTSIGRVQFVSGVPMLLGAVPVMQEGRALGTVVVGRKFESFARQFSARSLGVGLLVLADGGSAYTTLPGDTSGVHWGEATRAHRVEVRGTSYAVRSVARWPGVVLWVLLPDAELRVTRGLISTWMVGFLLFAACAVFVASWILTRRVLQPIEAIGEGARRVAQGDFDARVPPGHEKKLQEVARAFNDMGTFLQRWRREVEHRNRELEALNAVALTLNRSIDLVPTVEEALEVVRRVTAMDVAVLYQAAAASEEPSLVAQRGLTPESAEGFRTRSPQISSLSRAIKTGRPVAVHPPSGSGGAGPLPSSVQTQIALPIPVKGEVWGAMFLATGTARDFTPEDLQLMEAVAYQVGAAVERAALFVETREKGQRLESLVNVAQTVTARLDLDAVLESVIQAASSLIPESSVRLWVAEENQLVLRRESGTRGEAFGGRKTAFAFGEGLAGHVAQTGEPLIVERALDDPRTVNVEWIAEGGYVSFAGVPLLFQQRVLGVLAILTRQLTRFSREDVELLMSFATQAAIAIENARLYADASRSAAEHQALFEVAGLMGSTLKVERVLDVIVERARALLKVRAAGIFRVDSASDLLIYERGIGLSPEFIRSLRVRLGEGTSGKALQYRAPAWTTDLQNDPTVVLSEETRALVAREGYRAVLSVPILIKGKPYGVLAVYWWDQHAPAFSEIRLLNALASQAAVALDNAQLYEAATRRGKRLETLTALTQTVAGTLNVEEVLDRVAASAVGLFGSSESRLWLVDEGGETLSLRAHAGSITEDLGRTRLKVGEGLVGRIVATKTPLVVGNLQEDPRPVNRDRHMAEGAVSYAGAPMLLGDRAMGALGLALRAAHEFSDEEVSLLQSLANHAALAIENARLYQAAARRAARMRTLAEMGQLLVSTFDANRILEIVTTRCRESLDISDMGVFLLDEEREKLRFVYGFGTREAYWRTHYLGLGEGVAGRAAAENRPVWTQDVLNDPAITLRPETRTRIEAVGTHSVLAIPLSGERPFGALVVHRNPGHEFTDEEREFLVTFAHQVSVALENARLFSLEQARRAQVEALVEIERELAAELNPERLLDLIIERASGLVNGRGVVFLLDEAATSLVPHSWYGMPPGIRDLRIPFGVGIAGTAAAERRGVMANDFAQSPYGTSIRAHGIDALGSVHIIAQPLVFHDRLLGVITLNREAGQPPFTQTEFEIFRGFAAQAAIALENARLYAEIRERLKETQTLLAVGRVFSVNLPPQEAMRQVAREVGHTFEADMVGAYFLDAQKEALAPLAGYHVPKRLLRAFLDSPFPVARFRFLQEAWQTRKPVWSSDAMNDSRFDQEFLAAIRPRAVLFAPMLVRGEIRGGLFLVWWTPGRTFQPAELRLVEGVASQVGLALENTDLTRQMQEKLQEAETLLRISRVLSTTLEIEPLLRHFLREVARIIDADSVGVWLVDPATGWLDPLAGYHVPRHLLERIRETRIDPQESTFYAEAIAAKRVVVSSNVPEDPRLSDRQKASVPHRAQLFAPIVIKDQVIGAFMAVWWERTREFSERELALVEAMSNQAGVAIENARLFQENQRKLEELSVLHELSRAVTGQLDLAELVWAIHRQVARVLDARNMVIMLYDEARREVEVPLRMLEGEERPVPRRYPAGDGLFARLIERGRPIRTDDYAAECRREGVKPVEVSLPYPYWLGVPMVAGDRTIGGLILRSNIRPFTADDERLLLNIAGLAALAFRSARLFEERTRAFEELAAAQDQLIRTEKLRALGEMASGVAHDFNNLLASILGRAQLLLRKVEDPKFRQWLQVIERAATDGARTVRRIQEFARVRRDQPFVPVDLNAVVGEALEVTQSRWGEEAQSRGSTIEVTTNLDPAPAIAGDPSELREAFTNLILNAVDAMPAGGTLSLSTRVVEDHVVVQVGDTGVGISEEVQRLIFDPFFTTKGPKGTGLGLSITYGIVSRHGGQITVESAEGRGSTFSLAFPVSKAEPERPPASALPATPPVRCLVVDDEPLVLEAMGDLLTMAGHSAVLASNGAEAIARFKAEPFDLVLTDLAMPRLNGWQVARAVKDHSPSVPVLLVTGLGVELSTEELHAHGVDAVLPKPVKLEDVLSAVATFASRRREPRPASMQDAS